MTPSPYTSESLKRSSKVPGTERLIHLVGLVIGSRAEEDSCDFLCMCLCVFFFIPSSKH